MKHTLLRNVIVTFASFIFVITIVSAWQAPGATPPNGNVSAPVNIGTMSQVKTGGLRVASLVSDGGIKVGQTSASCDASLGGTLRYNSTSKCVEFCDESEWKCTNQAATLPPAPCTLWGETINSGDSRTAYSVATVPFGGSCSTVSETRTCTNGVLSGSYTNQTCTVASAPTCASKASYFNGYVYDERVYNGDQLCVYRLYGGDGNEWAFCNFTDKRCWGGEWGPALVTWTGTTYSSAPMNCDDVWTIYADWSISNWHEPGGQDPNAWFGPGYLTF